jgi:hypothetical protein
VTAGFLFEDCGRERGRIVPRALALPNPQHHVPI